MIKALLILLFYQFQFNLFKLKPENQECCMIIFVLNVYHYVERLECCIIAPPFTFSDIPELTTLTNDWGKFEVEIEWLYS